VKKKGAAVTERKLSEPGFEDCVARVSGTAMDPEALCADMERKGYGFFASATPSETEMEEIIQKFNRKYESMLAGSEEAQGTGAHGALMRPRESWKMRSFHPLVEAISIDEEKREIRCHIISEGMGNEKDRHYYGKESIRDFAEYLNGGRAYVNHPSSKEEADRPEGDVFKQAGFWKDMTVESIRERDTVVGTLCLDTSAAGDEAMAKAKHAIKMAKEFPEMREVYAGISVNADGDTEARTMTIDGEEVEVNYVTRVSESPKPGADVVTQPARGGKMMALVESIKSDPTGGTKIMDEALKAALAKMGERCKGLAESKDADAQAVYNMLVESAKQVCTLAKANGKEVKVAEGSKEEEVPPEDEKKKKDDTEEEEVPPEDEKKKKDDEVEEGKGKETKKESKAMADLRKDNEELRRKNKSLESKVSEEDTAARITEAGVGDMTDAKALSSFSPEQQKVMIGFMKNVKESTVTPIGTTQRGQGKRGGKPGDSFLESLNG